MKSRIIIFIILLSSGCNSNLSKENPQKPKDVSNVVIDSPSLLETVREQNLNIPINNNKRIKAIEDIYFGIPSSDHFKYFNKEIDLGDCNFRVSYLGYNDYLLSDKSVSGLYKFRLSSKTFCDNIDYMVKLFSTKYGSYEIIADSESIGVPDILDIRDIGKLDNGYLALMEGSLPSVSENQQSSIKFVTDQNTVFPINESIIPNKYNWNTDSISISLIEDYHYVPIGNGETFEYKGAQSGSRFNCEFVKSFRLEKKVLIDFVHRSNETEMKSYIESGKKEKEKDRFKTDSEKL